MSSSARAEARSILSSSMSDSPDSSSIVGDGSSWLGGRLTDWPSFELVGLKTVGIFLRSVAHWKKDEQSFGSQVGKTQVFFTIIFFKNEESVFEAEGVKWTRSWVKGTGRV